MDIWPEMLKVKDLQRFLGVSYSTLYRFRMSPDFPKPRRPTGKRAMYITDEVREWMKGLRK